MIKQIVGYILIAAGILDAWKYLWHIAAIKKAGTAKSHSRKFANAAITQDAVKLWYGVIIADMFIVISSIAALVTMLAYFYTIYLYYPYRYRSLINWKRPSLLKYFINSIQPNSKRKRL